MCFDELLDYLLNRFEILAEDNAHLKNEWRLATGRHYLAFAEKKCGGADDRNADHPNPGRTRADCHADRHGEDDVGGVLSVANNGAETHDREGAHEAERASDAFADHLGDHRDERAK